MSFQPNENIIRWRLHLSSPPSVVYEFLNSDEGRAKFWAESAAETNGQIDFRFPNGLKVKKRIIERSPPQRFVVEYLGGSVVTFELNEDGNNGTDLTLSDRGVAQEWRLETIAGWVSVLMALKAAVDYGVDLRNHDPQRTWEEGYVEN